ncbi:MAG: hypothetical protein ACC669_06590 [bacterium]
MSVPLVSGMLSFPMGVQNKIGTDIVVLVGSIVAFERCVKVT